MINAACNPGVERVRRTTSRHAIPSLVGERNAPQSRMISSLLPRGSGSCIRSPRKVSWSLSWHLGYPGFF